MDKTLKEILSVQSDEAKKRNRCRGCGGWGHDLVKEDGYCNHCGRHREVLHQPKKIKIETMTIDRLLDDAEKNYQEIKNDRQGIRQIIRELKEKMEINIFTRNKYKDEPMKFIDSEADLCETITKLDIIATVPIFYNELLDNNYIFILVELLQHENIDIVIELLKLVNDILDISIDNDDPNGEFIEGYLQGIVTQLYENKFYNILFDKIGRFNEFNDEDDLNGVFYSLSIVENTVEIRQSLSSMLCSSTSMFKVILARLEIKTFSITKLYSSELLFILVQSSNDNIDLFARLLVHDQYALLSLLKAISHWKKRDPVDSEESECVENLYDALYLLLTNQIIKRQFLKMDGYTLMQMILDNGKYAKINALKVIDYSTTNNIDNINYIINKNFIKYIMRSYICKGLSHKMRNKNDIHILAENIVNIIETIFLSFKPSDTQYQRMLKKFIEKDYEKTDRTIELYLDYYERVQRVYADIGTEMIAIDGVDIDQEIYLKKVNAGLLTLYKVCLLLGVLCIHYDISQFIKTKLKINKIKVENIILFLEDYIDLVKSKISDIDTTNKESTEASNMPVKDISKSQPGGGDESRLLSTCKEVILESIVRLKNL